jgi:hypothetical protein
MSLEHGITSRRGPRRRASLVIAALLLGATVAAAAALATSQPVVPQGAEIEVTAGDLSRHLSPRVAVFADGGFAIAWGAARSFNRKSFLHIRYFAADGSPATREIQLASGDLRSSPRLTPDALIVDPAGNLLLLYERFPDPETGSNSIYALRLNRRGAILGSPVRVSDPAQLGSCCAAVALVPPALGGGFVVAFSVLLNTTFDISEIHLHRLDPMGRPVAGELAVPASGFSDNPGVAGIGMAPDGSITLSLIGGTIEPVAGIQRIAPDGTASAPRTVTGDLGDLDRQGSPSLAMAPDGSFAAVWDANDGGGFFLGVWARYFAPDGTPRSGKIALSRPRGADQYLNYYGGNTAPLPGGGIVAVWSEDGSVRTESRTIRMRALDADGQRLTRDLLLNQATDGDRVSPVIAGNAAGDFVAVWLQQSGGSFALPESIRARRLK